MPLIFCQPYMDALIAIAISYELLFTEHTGGPINTTLYGITPSENKFDALPTPSLPANIKQAEYSPDGKFLAVATRYAPYLEMYRIEDDGTYTKLDIGNPTASTYPISGEPADGRPLSFTDDGRLCAVLRGTSTVNIFTINEDGTSYSRTKTIALGNTGTVAAACISSTGEYLAISANSTKGAYVYKWNGTTFVYVNQAAFGSDSPSAATWLQWSPTSSHLIGTTTNDTYSIILWGKVNDVMTRLTYRGTNGGLRTFTSTTDLQYIVSYGAVANGTYLHAFRWDGASTLTPLTIPQPTSLPTGVSFSSDGNYLALGLGNGGATVSKYQGKIYARNGNTFTALPGTLQTNTSFGAKPWFRKVPTM